MQKLKHMMMIGLVIALCCGLMVSAAGAEMVKKIVLFNEDVSNEERTQYALDWSTYGVSLLMDLPFINGILLSVPDSITSDDLADDPSVVSVEDCNQKVTLQAVTASADGGAADGGAADGGAADGGAADGGATSFVKPASEPAFFYRPWGHLRLFGMQYDPLDLTGYLDLWNFQAIGAPVLWEVAQQGIRIAIFDSGVDLYHPNLQGVIKGGIDLINLENAGIPQDDNGHGTHVAGTLFAQREPLFSGSDAGILLGLVNGSEIYSVKILDENAVGDVASLIMGIQWAIDNDIDVINMSVAYAEDNPALRLAVQKAHEYGIVMVAAVGNRSNWDIPAPSASADGGAADGGAADGGAADGGAADGGAADGGAADGGAATDESNVLPPYSVMYPARYPEVISVGAIDPLGDLAEFNTGGETDLLAPGSNILSLDLGGGFGTCSGTSMAVPHVTAVVAMMFARNPQLAPEQIKNILINTAVNGEINLIGALAAVGTTDGGMSSNTQSDGATSVFEKTSTLDDPINTPDTVDIVTILKVTYKSDLDKLVVKAESDESGGDLILTVEVRYADNTVELLGDLSYKSDKEIYKKSFKGVSEKPISVTVESSGGGFDTFEL